MEPPDDRSARAVTATTVAPPKLRRDGATRLIYLQLSLFAYFLYGFAPSVTLLRDEEHTSNAIAGLHGTTYALGVVVFGAVAARRCGCSSPRCARASART